MILEATRQLLETNGLPGRLTAPGTRVVLPRLPGASAAAVAAALAEGRPAPVVIVADTPGEADGLYADLGTLASPEESWYFPQREALPHEDADPHVEISGQRVEALNRLLSGRASILVTTARALSERSALPSGGRPLALELETGTGVERSALADRLEGMGFERVHTVEEIGEFAVRGGIVDVFPFGHGRPLRIELWDDEIASLRRFDLLTQRSVERLERAEVLPVQLGHGELGGADAGESIGNGASAPAGGPAERRSLLELLPERALLFLMNPASGRERRRRLREEVEGARARGSRARGLSPDDLVLAPSGAEERISSLARVEVEPEAVDGDGGAVAPGRGAGAGGPEAGAEGPRLDPGITPPPAVDRDMDRLVAVASAALDRGDRVLLMCDNEGQLERLEEILEEHGSVRLSRRVQLAIGSLSGGFRLPGPDPVLVLTDHEVFRRSHRLRRGDRFRGVATLESVASIQPGEYVVHMDHGIGRYRGLERVSVSGETIETLKIEYADGEILRLPHYRLDLVERYAVAGDGQEAPKPPRVHKLGGKRWKRLRERTEASIEETAIELLQLYAQRQVADGHGFEGETSWQREMESAFLYDETPDQLAAWEAVKEDMERPRPMDRLICGDVGFGKTEVAMRAAFKAVQDGKQVAMLSPTTILAEQHVHTFRERLAGFPLRIEGLSRFRTGAEQRRVIRGLASGELDIVIGTHRLLSEDIEFRDLGLLVVDEEQRFGVRQKERLKEFKKSVDVLTLTATPIPRTLQLALGGIRDLSVIETAPRDRMPVITHVLQWDDAILQDAMRRELDRGGQVFFVHDRVETIGALAERVRKLLPDARVRVAHGQMDERELEDVMAELMRGGAEVLVCTSIIENGLDVPTANTMIVHKADRFGLSQLYQLRGRVGRSHRRAYCYLLVPPDVSPDARRRLRVLEHHTELGSGYQVALRDLQLRGAGNLLGSEQSGFATAVGLDTYQRLVEKTVRRLKGEGDAGGERETRVSVDGDAYLPDDYILDPEQKMHLYRRLARMDESARIADLVEELRDRFGPLPEPARRLLAAAELGVLGTALEAEWIRVGDDGARIHFRPDATPRMSLLKNAFTDRQVAVEVRRLQPLSLVLERAGPEPLLPTLVDALELLASAEGEPVRAAAGGG